MYLQVINIIFILLSSVPVCTTDYLSVFEKEWKSAEKYVDSQIKAWEVIFPAFDVRAEQAIAVIFPELIRYSALQNFMETMAVKALYQQKGSKAADFSIGRFQMRPSFAEAVEKEWMQSEYRHTYEIYFDLSDNKEARRSRIRRLDDSHWQSIYLAIFLKLLYRRFPQLSGEADEQQIRLCATAYNASFIEDYDRLKEKAQKRFFHTDFIPHSQTVYYVYSDIAAYYYKTFKKRMGLN